MVVATIRRFCEAFRFAFLIATFALPAALSAPARAHDPDVHGGRFRTRDAGANWTLVSPGFFTSGALALAVNPRDPDLLLLSTDSGVWRSRNGGRDWAMEAPEVLAGAAFAAAFDADG